MQYADRTITIHVFEDQYLEDGAELIASSTTKKEDAAEYVVRWHDSYNAVGGQPKGALMRSYELYKEAFNYLQNELQGEAILFLDLNFIDGARKFIIPQNELNQDLVEFMQCYAGVRSIEEGMAYFNPKRLGLLLAFAASKNDGWGGIVCFASGQDIVDVERLKECLGTNERIQWWDPRRSLKGGSPLEARKDLITEAVKRLTRKSTGLPLWLPETSHWFGRDSPIPHDSPDPDLFPDVVEAIRNYLIQLLNGFIPPASWFRAPEWDILYETLKGLVGACCVFTTGDKNLRLPAVPLLLAAQLASKNKDISWLSSFKWDADGLFEIMEHKDRTTAREAVLAMAVCLEHLALGKNGIQVIGATWGPLENLYKHLWIDFRMDPLSGTATGRSLLQTIFGSRWGNTKGQTVTAYERMMETARRPPPNSSPKFSLCIYPEKDSLGQFTRLDFSIAPA